MYWRITAKFENLYVILLFLFVSFTAGAQQRQVINLNKGWDFRKGLSMSAGSEKWKSVEIPHTWNSEDVMDDEPGYYQGDAWYRRKLKVDPLWRDQSVFLHFEGAGQQAEVFVNGHKVKTHTGGYTGFSVPLSNFLNYDKAGENEIVVKVSNRYDEDVPPLSADFTFFGGIYRDVYLVIMGTVHFNHADASTGVYVSTPAVSAEKADLKIRAELSNTTGKARKVIVKNTLTKGNGEQVWEKISRISLKNDGSLSLSEQAGSVSRPHLWSPEDPYLYILSSKIYDLTSGKLLDEVLNPVGFRWFNFDPRKGFSLNGKPCKLFGASRHQDREGLGNALTNNLHYEDIKALKNLGANFLRIAHYPQDPAVLEACDQLGILASVEIPLVNAITESEAFSRNALNMQKEMIRQNYNHPGVIIWAYTNEILLKPKFRGNPERQQLYFDHIRKLALQLDDLSRKEDPYRYTMMAFHGDFDKYRQTGLVRIPMLAGWNLYSGWYGGKLSDFASFLDRHHHEFPEKPLLVTEFGADADPRIRSLQPGRFDKSIEYALAFHQEYIKAIESRPFVAAAMIWNLTDFNSESREETMPHINNKGLMTWGREKKDLYYLYQSHLLKKPYVKISDWRFRAGKADSSGSFCTQSVQVFTNAPEVELVHNHHTLGKSKVRDNIATFSVPFVQGMNTMEASVTEGDKVCRDIQEVAFSLFPQYLRDGLGYESLNVLLGVSRYFIDKEQGQIWMPDQEYKNGSWGHIGGEAFKPSQSGRQSYGTDRNILGTRSDPIYQTQQIGIEKYKLDVPDGYYELSLHFAELSTDEKKAALAYNLDSTVAENQAEPRVFDVLVNGKPFLQGYDIAGNYGRLTAVSEITRVITQHGEGLEISFKPVKGRPVLNAIQVRRIY